MATSFKSNRVATKYIKDVAGYKGPTDFIANADFSNDIYLKNNVSVAINDVLSSTRNSASSVLLSSNLDHAFVPANTLRRSYIPDYSAFGVIADLANEDRLENPDWAQVFLPDTTGKPTWSIYSLVGSATLNPTEVEIISGTGTIGNPQYFKYKNTQYPKITRSGGAKEVCCVLITPFYQTPFVPYFTAKTGANEQLNVASSVLGRASGTIVIRYAEPNRNTSIPKDVITEKPMIKLEANNMNYFALAKQQHTEKMMIRYFVDGKEEGFLIVPQLLAKNSGVNTLALTWQNGVLNIATNGKCVQLAGLSMGSAFSVNAATVLSTIDGWIPRSSNNALLNLITYNRALSVSELEVATKF